MRLVSVQYFWRCCSQLHSFVLRSVRPGSKNLSLLQFSKYKQLRRHKTFPAARTCGSCQSCFKLAKLNKLIQSHGHYTALHWRSCSHIFLSHRNGLVSSDVATSPAKHGAELIGSLLWLTLNLISHSPHRQTPTSLVQKRLTMRSPSDRVSACLQRRCGNSTHLGHARIEETPSELLKKGDCFSWLGGTFLFCTSAAQSLAPARTSSS